MEKIKYSTATDENDENDENHQIQNPPEKVLKEIPQALLYFIFFIHMGLLI